MHFPLWPQLGASSCFFDLDRCGRRALRRKSIWSVTKICLQAVTQCYELLSPQIESGFYARLARTEATKRHKTVNDP